MKVKKLCTSHKNVDTSSINLIPSVHKFSKTLGSRFWIWQTPFIYKKKLVYSTVILGWVDALVIWLGGKLLVAIQKKDSWSFQS